jgi:hypothetical protein
MSSRSRLVLLFYVQYPPPRRPILIPTSNTIHVSTLLHPSYPFLFQFFLKKAGKEKTTRGTPSLPWTTPPLRLQRRRRSVALLDVRSLPPPATPYTYPCFYILPTPSSFSFFLKKKGRKGENHARHPVPTVDDAAAPSSAPPPLCGFRRRRAQAYSPRPPQSLISPCLLQHVLQLPCYPRPPAQPTAARAPRATAARSCVPRPPRHRCWPPAQPTRHRRAIPAESGTAAPAPQTAAARSHAMAGGAASPSPHGLAPSPASTASALPAPTAASSTSSTTATVTSRSVDAYDESEDDAHSHAHAGRDR